MESRSCQASQAALDLAMSEESRTVNLTGGSPWGLRIQGGADFRAPLKVTKVSPGGKAALAGIQVSDVIAQIGETDCASLRHSEALFLIRTSGSCLSLVLQKGGSVPSPYQPPKLQASVLAKPAPASPAEKPASAAASPPIPAETPEPSSLSGSPERQKPAPPHQSPGRVPESTGFEKESAGGKEWYRAMHRSQEASQSEEMPQQFTCDKNEKEPTKPQPIKPKPRSYQFIAPALTSPPAQPTPSQPIPYQAVPSQSLPPQPVPSQPIPSQPIPSQSVPSQPIPYQSVPSQSLPPHPVPSQSVPSESLTPQPVPSQPIPSQPIPSQSVPSQPIPYQSVPSQSLPPHPVPSQSVPSESLTPQPVPSQSPSSQPLTFHPESSPPTNGNASSGSVSPPNLSPEYAVPDQSNPAETAAPKAPIPDSEKRRSGKRKRELKPPPADWARALYDFSAETKHELSFKKGAKLRLLRTVDDNWLEAQLQNARGIIPVSYVEVFSVPGPSVPGPSASSPSASSPVASGPHARALYDFAAEEAYELAFQKGQVVALLSRVDENWLQGRVGDKTGIFPASFVEVAVPLGETAPTEQLIENEIRTRGNSHQSPPLQQGEMFRAVYSYAPQNSDELALSPGTEVFVVRRCEDGWFMGYSEETGAFGTFPGNYVEAIL